MYGFCAGKSEMIFLVKSEVIVFSEHPVSRNFVDIYSAWQAEPRTRSSRGISHSINVKFPAVMFISFSVMARVTIFCTGVCYSTTV